MESGLRRECVNGVSYSPPLDSFLLDFHCAMSRNLTVEGADSHGSLPLFPSPSNPFHPDETHVKQYNHMTPTPQGIKFPRVEETAAGRRKQEESFILVQVDCWILPTDSSKCII